MNTEQMKRRLAQIGREAESLRDAASAQDDGFTPEQGAKIQQLLAESESLHIQLKIDHMDEPVAPRIKPPQPQNHAHESTEHYQASTYGAAPPKWRTKSGADVHVLNKGDSLVQRMGSAGQTDLTLGGFLRAMVGVGDGAKYRNTLQEGTDSTGGYTVPHILTAQLIDKLRAQSVLMRAGATTMVLPDGGEVSMAKLTGDPTAYWHQESVSVTASTPSFGRVTFQPRTLISLVKASRELLEDSINAEEALMMAFAQALALEVDRVGLIGTGAAGEPLGVLNTTGIGNVLMGANGLALTNWDPYVNVIYQLTQDNAMMPTAFIQNPRTTTEGAVLKDSQNQPLQKPDILQDIPILETTQVPINDTQGSATDASRVYAGYWPDLVWGVRHELVIEILREKYSDTFEYGFMAHLRGDYVVRHPESFATITGVIPA